MKTSTVIAFTSALVVVTGCSSVHSADVPSVDQVTEAASAAGQYAYSFDKSGIVTSVGSGSGLYAITRTGDTLQAGTDAYRFDAIGRVTAVSDLALSYGPTGHIARAVRGTKTVSYVYDENGERILKNTNGAPTAAYVDGMYVTATELDEPVRVDGKVVGLLRNGRFAMAPTDARGTVQGDTDGTARLASPFGARPVHPDVAAALDYAQKGYDADLGFVRMGVRDYDARVARFLQPDPLFLREPERCIKSPAECNLYGYARGRPLDFVDPSGTEVRLAAGVSDAYKMDYANAIAYLRKSETGAKLIAAMEGDSHVIIIRPPSGAETGQSPFFRASPSDCWFARFFGYQTREIVWDPHTAVKPTEGGVVTPALALAHEGDHALQQITNQKQFDMDVANTTDPMFGNMEERRVETGKENQMARELGEVVRTSHWGTVGTVSCPTCTK